MKLSRFKVLLVGLIMLFPTLLFGGEVYDVVTYWGYTEEYVTVGWDSVINAEYYNIKLFHKEQQVEIARGRIDDPTTQIIVAFPRSGHYIVMVNSCNHNSEGVEQCSDVWAESVDPQYAEVNGQPKGWWVYRHISPPVIE
jgi:hypothetical protein